MKKNVTLDILKQAILLEQRGKVFYESIAQKVENEAVRKIFDMLAEEELKHIHTLFDQFKAYHENKNFIFGDFKKEDTGSTASEVLTQEIKEEISAAGFEAAAISAGIALEERAIQFYKKSALTVSNDEAKALYNWLAEWERDHLNLLLDIDKALKEKIWFDNQFWPF